MSKKRLCDVCGEEINRTYAVGSGKVRKGRGSASIQRSYRRQIIRWILGPIIKLYTYTGSGSNQWEKTDLCASCKREMIEYIKENS